MKILHISYIETNAGWGAEYFVDRAFRELGYVVYEVDFKKNERHLSEILSTYDDFDVLFLQRGDWFPIELLKASKKPCVFWASELVSRCRDQDRLFSTKLFSHIFVHSEDCKIRLEKWKTKIADNTGVSLLINAFDEKMHRKLNINKKTDVLFIGSMTARRKIELEKLKESCIHDIKCLTNVYGEDFVRAVNEAKIVINIHASKNKDTETRVFEVLGCGTFLVSEELSEENPFIPGRHYIEANIKDFPKIISYYLEHEDERKVIEDAGYREAQAKHSYHARTKNNIVPVLERVSDEKQKSELCWDEDIIKKYHRFEQNTMYWIVRKTWIKIFQYYQKFYDWRNVR